MITILNLLLALIFTTNAQFTVEEKAMLMNSEFKTSQLSPDGQKLAISFERDKQDNLAIIDLKTLKPLSASAMGENYHIRNLLWINNDKVLFSVAYAEGYLKRNTTSKGFIYSQNIDGSGKKQIFPATRKTNKLATIKFSDSSFLSNKFIDKDYVLVLERTYNRSGGLQRVMKVNVNSGRSSLYNGLNLKKGMNVFDNNYKPRLILKLKDLDHIDLGYKKSEGKWEYKKIGTEIFKNLSEIKPIGFSKDNKTFYFLAEKNKKPSGLYSATLNETGAPKNLKLIFSDKDSEVSNVKVDHSTKELLYLEYGNFKPKRKYLSNNAKVKTIKTIQSLFKDEIVSFIQDTKDKYLLVVYSDKRPATYYTFNKKTNAVDKLISTGESINYKLNVESKAVSYLARDGLKITGFLYRPKNQTKPGPLLINIHGGPFGVKDRWGFKGDNQYFVRKGYSVMTLNYRGSGGRGAEFIDAGKEVIGTKMQYDIIDASKWAVDNKITTKGNIALWGVSYGAYASIMSLIVNDSYFACGLASGGPFNFLTQLKTSDTKDSKFGLKHWKRMLPKTKEGLKLASPTFQADKINKPVYIFHGNLDARVPVSQSRGLKKALKKQKKKFQYKEYKGEGHWYMEEKNRLDFYKRALKFFDKHLKKA